jgi:tetratricopeptide (TPR) repeat protein
MEKPNDNQMTQPDQIAPPDDTGSSTFARFKYQAHVTFPYCFELTREDAIGSVFAEHIEDIAVDFGGSWRFLQVKTRNADLGPWTFAEVENSKGFRSLWRAYQTVDPSVKATYELQLEGAVKSGDVLLSLVSSGVRDDAFRTRLAKAIGVEVPDVYLFANRLRVRELPQRRSIIAENLQLLGTEAPHLAAGEIRRIYEAALIAIEAAMTADQLDDDWPAVLFMLPDDRIPSRIESKRISRELAREIFAPILAANPGRRIPFILPQLDVPTFTGRSEELQRLEAILLRQDGQKVSSIAGVSGSGGIGKSALACHFAELHRGAFPDGVIGLRVDGKEPIAIAREFARCAFAEIDSGDDRDASTIMQEIFRDRRALLIFDNAHDVSIRSLIPGGTRCAVIFTTRDRGLPVALGISEEARLDLSPLPLDEAIALLERLVGERVTLDVETARRISTLIGSLPLAIQIVGATLQVQTWRLLSDYEEALREEKQRLSLLRVHGDSELDVRASLSLSLRLLESTEVELFASLAVCGQDGFSILAAAAASACDERTAQDRLTQLYRLSLVNRSSVGANRFVLHPLLRLFAREQAEERCLLEPAETRHRDFFVALVKRRDANDPEVASLFGQEMDEIVAAAESMRRHGTPDYEYVIRLEPFLQRHGYWEKAASIFAAFLHSAEQQNNWAAVVQLQVQQAKFLGLRGNFDEAAQLLSKLDPYVAFMEPENVRKRTTAMVLNTLGGVLQRQGKFDEAINVFERSYSLLLDVGDTGGQAMVLNSLGGTLHRKGNLDKAAEILRRSAAIDQALGNARGEAMTLNSLGTVLQRQGAFKEAADMFSRSAVIDRALGNRRGEMMTLNSLGTVLQRQGNFDGAIVALRRCEELEATLGDLRGEAMVLNSLGSVLHRKGDFAGAIEVLRRSASIEERLGNVRGHAMALTSLGGVLQRQGDFDGAAEALRQSASIEARLGNERGEGIVLNSLGGVFQRQGNLDQAVNAFRESIAIGEKQNDRLHIAMALNSLGGALQRQGKFDEALDAFRRGYAILIELQDQRSLAMVLNSIGGVLQRQGKLDEAVDEFRRSQTISESLGDERSLAMILNSLGGVLQRQRKLDDALDAFRRSQAISEALRDERSLAMVLNSLGGVLQKQKKPEEAEQAFRRSLHLSSGLRDKRGQAMVLNSLGGLLSQQGRLDEAIELFRNSIAMGEKLRDRRHLAMVHTAFGCALLERDVEVAVCELREGFELDAAMKNRKGIGIVAPILVETLARLRRTAEASAVCERALAITPANRRLLRLKRDLKSRT